LVFSEAQAVGSVACRLSIEVVKKRKCRRINVGAPFETAASRPPQDEEIFFIPSKDYPRAVARGSAQRARLEARTISIQSIRYCSFRFFTTSMVER
jgi:hypothetical protein